MEIEFIKCPICFVDETEELSSSVSPRIKQKVVICKRCGLVYLNPRWISK